MKILPITQQDYMLYPINEGDEAIEITEEEYAGITEGTHCFSEDLKSVIPAPQEILAKRLKEKNKEETAAEISALKQKLCELDYKGQKRIDGEYSEEEWAEAVAERKAIRERIRCAEAEYAAHTQE